MFIEVKSKDDASVFLVKESIMKLSIGKDESVRQSERLVKVEFNNGSTGTYKIHRDSEEKLRSLLTGASAVPTNECVETSVEEPALATV